MQYKTKCIYLTFLWALKIILLDRRCVREERQGQGREAVQGGVHRDDVQDQQIDPSPPPQFGLRWPKLSLHGSVYSGT